MVVRRLICLLALVTGACGRRSIHEGVPVAPAHGSTASALADCIERIDSADGTGPCDCLELVDPRDGIDATEARAIAKAYFAAQPLAEFGGAGPPTRHGEDWFSIGQFGTNLRKRVPDSIKISASTGAVSFPGHASFTTVSDLRASARGASCWGRADLKALAAERRGARP
jgi:hypothetical protein